jgi:two-component system chemotaxis sensor kinase CheA
MTVDMSQFYQVFFEETGEHLANMENLLLNLDVEAPSLEDLNAIFRAAHSIKGGSGTFGFTDMTGVTHILETLPRGRSREHPLGLRKPGNAVPRSGPDRIGASAAGYANRAIGQHAPKNST